MEKIAKITMEKNIFLEIEYVGTNYFGLQIQKKKGKEEPTVQSALEDALKRLFKQKITITCSGRTDRGVHAKGQVVNFRIRTGIPLKNIKIVLNVFLPRDIRVKKIKKVSLGFHARVWAKSKIYRYVILQRREDSVFLNDFAWHIDKPLNLRDMEKVSKKLTGEKDFSLFAKEAKKYETCVRKLKDISIKKRGAFIYIDIEAEGFLRNMARNIVAFLVKVGNGKIPFKDVAGILEGNIFYANKPAPARGLYLSKVKY